MVLRYRTGPLGMHLLLRRAIGLTVLTGGRGRPPAVVNLNSVFMFSDGLAGHVVEGRGALLTAVYIPFLTQRVLSPC